MLNVNIQAFKYAKTPVLKAINFKLIKGEHISILGESGCGKSTLANVLAGKEDYEILNGRINFKDNNLFDLNIIALLNIVLIFSIFCNFSICSSS